MRRRTVALLVLGLALAGCGGGGGPDFDEPTRTGRTTPEGEHCVAELPNGDCLTEEEGERGADRWAEYTRCVAEDEVPNDECPTPGEQP